MEDIGDKLKEIPLSLAVDVRYDTPGGPHRGRRVNIETDGQHS